MLVVEKFQVENFLVPGFFLACHEIFRWKFRGKQRKFLGVQNFFGFCPEIFSWKFCDWQKILAFWNFLGSVIKLSAENFVTYKKNFLVFRNFSDSVTKFIAENFVKKNLGVQKFFKLFHDISTENFLTNKKSFLEYRNF